MPQEVQSGPDLDVSQESNEELEEEPLTAQDALETVSALPSQPQIIKQPYRAPEAPFPEQQILMQPTRKTISMQPPSASGLDPSLAHAPVLPEHIPTEYVYKPTTWTQLRSYISPTREGLMNGIPNDNSLYATSIKTDFRDGKETEGTLWFYKNETDGLWELVVNNRQGGPVRELLLTPQIYMILEGHYIIFRKEGFKMGIFKHNYDSREPTTQPNQRIPDPENALFLARMIHEMCTNGKQAILQLNQKLDPLTWLDCPMYKL